MFSARRKQPLGSIDLAEQVDELHDATEVLRVFVGKGDNCVPGVFVNIPDNFTPFMFGILLADLVHHAGKAYAHAFGVDDKAAIYEVSQGLAAELANPTDEAEQHNPEEND